MLRLVDHSHRLFFLGIFLYGRLDVKVPLWVFLDILFNLLNGISQILVDNFDSDSCLSQFVLLVLSGGQARCLIAKVNAGAEFTLLVHY